MAWEAPGYTEIKQLGAGASGRVVLAVHDETGIKVAVKYLSDRWRRDPVALARFRSEARLLTTLRDPNVATLWEYVQDPQGAAIVMELVNGVSLRALLRESGTTGPEAALVVLKGSLLGLARAHALGLVHRDYKPENVIVRDDGASKLVDFGIAVRQGTLAVAEGTPPYMAPELWAGEPTSPATDVYAATAVFFECLTGHRPYRSSEPSVLGYQHVHAPIPAHDAPEPVRELILRGLAKDPSARPRSADAFVAELEETARAAYGEDWEERGRRRLAGLVLLLALLLPQPPPPPPTEAATTLAHTVFRSARAMRAHAVKVAMGTALVALVAVAVMVVMTVRDRTTPIGAVVAGPTEPGSQAGLISPPATPAAVPQRTPEETLTESPSPSRPPTGELPSVSTGVTPGPETTFSTGIRPDPGTSTPPVTGPPTTSRPPATPVTTPPATPRTTPPTTPVTTPPVTTPPVTTPPVTTPPVTTVATLRLDGFAVDGTVTGGTFTVGATGTAPITVDAAWRVGGQSVHTERLRLAGATAYTRTLRHTLAERPCGQDVTFTITTSPAAPGGAKSSTVSVPPCPTRVTGLSVSLRMAAAPGGTVRATLTMTTSGTTAVPVTAAFAVDGDRVATREATLSGRTSYTRIFSHAFRSRPCEATVSVQVRAGGRTATARTGVTCPAEVRSVTIQRAALSEGTAVASIAVTTANTRPVRLSVVFSVGGAPAGSQTVTLSGRTSYTTTVERALGKVPCGTSWTVRATTRPGGGGGDSAGGRTPVCPSPEQPTESPEEPTETKPPQTREPETPSTLT